MKILSYPHSIDPHGEPCFIKRRRPKFTFGLALKIVAAMLLVSIMIPLVLRWVPPPTSAYMMRASVAGRRNEYLWISYNRISRQLPVAVVAAEDQKFPQHMGFDFDAIGKALDENKHRTRPRGASTISQQVAKNLFLWPGRSYLRKGLEAYFTVIIETLWPKRRILEVYLNIAEFGVGVFGAEAAARKFFNKPASQLDKSEAALLAAVLPNPKRLMAAEPSAYVRQRAMEIEAQMDHLGGTTYLKEVWPVR